MSRVNSENEEVRGFKRAVISGAMFLYVYGEGSTFGLKRCKFRVSAMPVHPLPRLGTCSTSGEHRHFWLVSAEINDRSAL